MSRGVTMFNRCEFIGHLGRDPETRFTQGGEKVVSLSLGVSESWRDKQSGERKERTEWVRIVIWNQGLADVAEKYLKKGSRCFISGSLQTRSWTDQQGEKKYSTEIVLSKFRGELVLLDSRKDGGEERQGPSAKPSTDLDDEIPF